MFVLSFRTDRRKTIAVLAAALVVVTAVMVLTRLHQSAPTAECAGKKYSLAASTNAERIAFFKQFGWEVKAEPLSTQDVTIPQKFDEVYVNYNNIQQEQGLDLTPYAGKTCKQWIYEVTNYPQQESMRGTILVLNGQVIGGDLSTPALDGFMTGFDGQVESEDFSQGQPTLSRGLNGVLTLDSGTKKSSANTSSVEEAKKPVSSQIPANAWPTD